jgi:hypothetical protein
MRSPDLTRWPRRLALLLLLVVFILAVSAWAACPSRAATDGWQWPVTPATVVRGFSADDQPYGAGHRGVDLAAHPGQPVHAAAAGVVSFTGWVAGRPLVVIAHAHDLRTTYEPVDPLVRVGQVVDGGQPIGTVAAHPRHCGWFVCLHWGLREGTRYLDPMMLLDAGPPRLLPLWGAPTASTVVPAATGPAASTGPAGATRSRSHRLPAAMALGAAATTAGAGLVSAGRARRPRGRSRPATTPPRAR